METGESLTRNIHVIITEQTLQTLRSSFSLSAAELVEVRLCPDMPGPQ